MFFLVEKMEGLVAEESDMGMLRQKIVDRGRARFLHAGDDKAHPIDLSPLPASEGRQSAGERLPVSLVRFDL